MPAYKDEKTGSWYASFYYENWKGDHPKKMKRGFKTKKAAQEWEREFLLQKAADMNMQTLNEYHLEILFEGSDEEKLDFSIRREGR